MNKIGLNMATAFLWVAIYFSGCLYMAKNHARIFALFKYYFHYSFCYRIYHFAL